MNRYSVYLHRLTWRNYQCAIYKGDVLVSDVRCTSARAALRVAVSQVRALRHREQACWRDLWMEDDTDIHARNIHHVALTVLSVHERPTVRP